jgi:uncharacterized protein (TIGR02996 family)
MSDEEAFLAALKANPADDTARLVYADWLDEHNEPAKGQYLRAVVDLARLSGGTAEYNDAAGRLYTACPRTDAEWRATGARFDVVLEGYEVYYKIHAIKVIRERTGFGLGEAKSLAESVPTPLFSWLPFEVAFPHLLAFRTDDYRKRPVPIRASIRPTMWPEGASGSVFDVLICSIDVDRLSGTACSHVARLLNVSPAEAAERLRNLPLVVGSGLHPTKVAEFVNELKRTCNVLPALPAGAIRVVPRLPTA